MAAHGRKEVIVDIDDDGREDWGEQYPGECRWYPFAPTRADRARITRQRRAGQTAAIEAQVLR